MFNRGPFLVPIFGVQIWTKIWPPKLTKNVRKFPDRVCPEGEPVWHTEMLRKLSDLAHENNQIFPNRLHIWFPNRAKHDFESGPIICANFDCQKGSRSGTPEGVCVATDKGVHIWCAWVPQHPEPERVEVWHPSKEQQLEVGRVLLVAAVFLLQAYSVRGWRF